jgi:hypothetical protein
MLMTISSPSPGTLIFIPDKSSRNKEGNEKNKEEDSSYERESTHEAIKGKYFDFAPMDNHGEFLLENLLNCHQSWLDAFKNEFISHCPNAPTEEDDNFHEKGT